MGVSGFVIKYRGIMTEMYVTGFSQPMDVGAGEMERSVKASNLIGDAEVFNDSNVEDALALTLRCQPTVEKVSL